MKKNKTKKNRILFFRLQLLKLVVKQGNKQTRHPLAGCSFSARGAAVDLNDGEVAPLLFHGSTAGGSALAFTDITADFRKHD